MPLYITAEAVMESREVIPTKPYCTQYDLSLAYTPG